MRAGFVTCRMNNMRAHFGKSQIIIIIIIILGFAVALARRGASEEAR